MGIIGAIEFPFTWIFFLLGAPIVTAYYLYIFVKVSVLAGRVYLVQDLVGLRMTEYLKKVIYPITKVTVISAIFPVTVLYLFEESIWRLFFSVIVGVTSVTLFSFLLGLTTNERAVILKKIKAKISCISH